MIYRILVTGGAGYIGSHTVKRLLNEGYEVFVVDNLSTGSEKLLQNKNFSKCDISDTRRLDEIFKDFRPHAVIHFAASKDAPESVSNPEKYFRNNVSGTLDLLSVMLKNEVKNIIFSSTAAVYGDVQEWPITEAFPTSPTNPYGLSKLMIEQILLEYQKAYSLRPIIFRYFNAGGADSDGEIGNLYPNSRDVISMVIKAAKEEIPKFEIYGSDYDTKDGTCIRDIIHVEDLAEAHVLGLEGLLNDGLVGTFNLGSENGYSIREIVEETKKITKNDFMVAESPRRSGDIVVSIASSEKAKRELGWKPKRGLSDIILSAWNWAKKG